MGKTFQLPNTRLLWMGCFGTDIWSFHYSIRADRGQHVFFHGGTCQRCSMTSTTDDSRWRARTGIEKNERWGNMSNNFDVFDDRFAGCIFIDWWGGGVGQILGKSLIKSTESSTNDSHVEPTLLGNWHPEWILNKWITGALQLQRCR